MTSTGRRGVGPLHLPQRIILPLMATLLALTGCSAEVTPLAVVSIVESPAPTVKPTDLPMPTHKPTLTVTPTSIPTQTPTPSATPPPGSNLIAFETYRDGNGEIYLLDSSTGASTNLTRHAADDRAPAWRPDGGAIAFESRRDGNWDIYVLELADASIRRLTDSLAYDGAPAWSPDGGQIAFESYRDGNLEIYVVSTSGGEPRRVTEEVAGDYGPAWSPDGRSIAFTSWRDGNKEIYIVPAEGGEAENLTQHPADDEDPAWAEDGLTLAFVSWRDIDGDTGNRNAEIYLLSVKGGSEDRLVERLTDHPWPDLDPAWDAEGRLLWASYDPGAPFETYDPFRPGETHLYRTGPAALERLTDSAWDDRRPSTAPLEATLPDSLGENLPPEPPPLAPFPTLVPGVLVDIVEVPGILASFSGQPVRVSELVAPSLLSWQQQVLQASGWDFLHETLGAWRNLDQVRKKELYAYDYGYLSWHKAGRALDLALEYKVDGRNQMVLVREDLAMNVFWRMYLRTARQDGSQGEPLRDNPWLHWWHIVPDHEPEAYDAGGKRLPIPDGYYVDVTAIGRRNGWEQIACYAIKGDYHWLSDSNGTEYWHYERTDGLTWWDAMLQIYPPETLQEHVGWEAGLQHAQSEEMMLSKGVPTPTP